MKREADSLRTTPLELVAELAAEPPKCMKCGATEHVSTYKIVVDDIFEPIDARATLCDDDGEWFIFAFGEALGRLLRPRR